MRHLIFVSLVCVYVLLSGALSSSYAQTENTAVGDPGFIEEKYMALAATGDKRAQFYLGLMHEAGVAANSSQSAAVEWYKKAAAQSFLPAIYKLGLLYQKGISGNKPDMVAAAEHYREAAEQGFAEAQYNLGYLYETGQGVTRSEKIAVEWYKKAADQDVANAMRALGILYHRGLGVGQNSVEAWIWMVRAVEAGDEPAAKLAADFGDLLTESEKALAEEILNAR